MPVQFNNAFFDGLGRSAGVKQLVDQAVARIAASARGSAPVDKGDYRRGIVATGKFQRRYVGLVVGTDPKTMLIESRTGNLARALQKARRRG